MEKIVLPNTTQPNDLELLGLLTQCEGFYEQPPGGPLVGYAGRYSPDNKQYVGRVYVNFAKAERYGNVLQYFALRLIRKYHQITEPGTCFCGAPEGGKALASALAVITENDYIFPEKVVTELKTPHSREKSTLAWGRHLPEKGSSIYIVEDICNNFSTTMEMVTLIQSAGAKVAGIICFLNRSLQVNDTFHPNNTPNIGIPVMALIRKPIEEFRQDNQTVSEDIKKGNVVWKPKDKWSSLMEAMNNT